MPTDIAINPNTGDLVIAKNNDFSLRTGTEVIEQEIRTRLRIIKGQWQLDPTNGEIGSDLRTLARVPAWQAVTDAPRMVREALAPMRELHIHNVNANVDPDDNRRIVIDLTYSVIEPSGEASATQLDLSTTLTLAG